jgi:hypothetical protein
MTRDDLYRLYICCKAQQIPLKEITLDRQDFENLLLSFVRESPYFDPFPYFYGEKTSYSLFGFRVSRGEEHNL